MRPFLVRSAATSTATPAVMLSAARIGVAAMAALLLVTSFALSSEGCRKPALEGGAPEVAAAPASAPTPVAAPVPPPPPPPAPPARPPRRFARIDAHAHIDPDAIDRTLRLLDRWGIDGIINLSGMYPGPPRFVLETQLRAAAAGQGRIAVMANADFRLARQEPEFGRFMADQLEQAKHMGAVGLKIPKGLGLGYVDASGKLIPVDDPRLDPLFQKAGELGMPVSIHVGDPKAFWKPADEKNERLDELKAHPEWSFYGAAVPSWEQLYAAFERRVARHPKTTFIGVHFGNAPEDPERVARMLNKYRNFYIDTAARVPEIGRHPADKMRRFYEKYQDRVLFGTDLGVAPSQGDMMYGSTGSQPPTEADEILYFTATWRYFETTDRQFDHPTPIQGRWKIDGVGLPEGVLRKIYFDNAARLFKWKPPIK